MARKASVNSLETKKKERPIYLFQILYMINDEVYKHSLHANYAIFDENRLVFCKETNGKHSKVAAFKNWTFFGIIEEEKTP